MSDSPRERRPFTPLDLQEQRQRLRTQRMVPATSMHENITLRREAAQSAEHFTDFMVDTRRALHTIASEARGNALLGSLENAPNTSLSDFHSTVVISDSRFTQAGYNPLAGNETGAPQYGLHTRASLAPNSEPGLGEASRVFYNPTLTRSDGARPSFIGLAHELVHAQRNQVGVAVLREGGAGFGAVRDELETVGLLGGPQQQTTTENLIREEHGIPLRLTYSGHTRATYIEALRQAQAQAQRQQQAQQPQPQPQPHDQGGQGGGSGGNG